jgi:hypothetical protein
MSNVRTLFTPRVLALVLAGVGVVVLVLASLAFIDSPGFAYDFHAYDLAARRIASGEPLYPPGTAGAYSAGAFEGLYLYPPPLAIALVPLTALGPHEAAVAFFFLRIGLLVAACAVLPVRREVRLATFGVACLSLPVLYDLNLGNMSVVVFALSAAIWRLQRRGVAGAFLTAAGAVRPPFVAVGIGWLARGSFRPIVGTAVACLVMVAITLPIVGLSGWQDYVTILRGLGPISTGPHNISLGSTALALGLGETASRLALYAGYATGLAAIGLAARRRDTDVALVVSVTATLLLSPFIHSHYLVLLLLPAALLAERGRWIALGLPLLGWLPDEWLPVVALVALVWPLLPGLPVRIATTASSNAEAG